MEIVNNFLRPTKSIESTGSIQMVDRVDRIDKDG